LLNEASKAAAVEIGRKSDISVTTG